jgi:hypothetical protein
MSTVPADALDRARRDTGLTQDQLWLRYFGLGGMRAGLEVEAILFGALEPTALDRDRIVHALNERFTELGRNHPVPYSGDAGAP